MSVFLVNRCPPFEDQRDRAVAFQAELEVRGDEAFVPKSEPGPAGSISSSCRE